KAARLHVGDLIQLGHNGPRMQVLEIDTIGAPEGPDGPAEILAPRRMKWRIENVLVTGGVIAAFVLVVALTAILLSRETEPPPPGPNGVVEGPEPLVKPPDAKPLEVKPPDPTPLDTKPPEAKPPEVAPPEVKPPAVKPSPVPPTVERRIVGKFEPASQPVGVVVRRAEGKRPWERVQPQGHVQTDDLLVCLPGYRSELALDSGVQLTLWGNVQEQLAWPILESAIVLHPPPAGTDLSFTLDRGRVAITNRKNGPAQVQVQFADQTWDLTLADSQSEVGLELLGREGGLEGGPLLFVGLVVLKGQAQLRVGVQQFALQAPPGPALYTWANHGPSAPGPQPLPDEVAPLWHKTLPATWQWQKLPVPQQQAAQKTYEAMRQALNELSNRLNTAASLHVVLAEDMRSPRPMTRELAVLSLGAVDALPEVLDALADEKFPDVREAAVMALRHWLGRREEQAKKLRQALLEKRYSDSQADTLLRLLHTFSAEDRAKRDTYEMLIEYLRHDQPAVRQLAAWHLYRLVPDARKIPYDPAAGVQQRQAAYEVWRKLLASGSLPPKAPAPPRPQP
ncbi:MAG TPA: hypothetical protein VNK04_01660, partial [Gemmataceae bacterium]|nr:hypothetical protein [Gemmataceae bacterium]